MRKPHVGIPPGFKIAVNEEGVVAGRVIRDVRTPAALRANHLHIRRVLGSASFPTRMMTKTCLIGGAFNTVAATNGELPLHAPRQ